MALNQKAIVVVSRDWINTGVRHLVNRGQESRSTSDTHIIFSEVDDVSDQRGLWLKDVSTTALTKDGSKTTMRLMIPWAYIVALGLIEGDMPERKPGFAGGIIFEAAEDAN